ncbi:MAG TPA: vWA domain-containing protein [Kofleriaceae bacterium]
MRRLLAFLAVIPALAIADDDDLAPPATLISVRATLDGEFANVVVRYDLAVRGAKLWRDSYHLDLPYGGVVTGATAFVDGTPHALELLDKQATGSALDALGSGSDEAGAPWTFAIDDSGYHRNQVDVEVGTPRSAHVRIELAVHAGTCFFRDTRYVAIDPAWVPRASGAIRTTGTSPLDELCGDRYEHEPGAYLPLADATLAKQTGDARIGTSVDRLVLTSTDIVRVEVDVAGMLAPLPDDLYTAFVIDNSRSLTSRESWEQAALIASYLSKAPAAHVQVIAFDRRARALLPNWLVASSARAMIAKSLELIVPANGSNLDVGLAEAEAWLDRVHGTKRIVAFSDARLPHRLAPGAITTPQGIVIHTVELEGNDGVLERNDNSQLATIAQRTEGVGFTTAHGDLDATVLVHPIEFEDIHVDAAGRTPISGEECNDRTFAQGTSCTWIASGRVDAPIHISGRVWGHEIDRQISPSDAHAVQLARELVTESLDDNLQAEVNVAARAVDSAWSLFATWGQGGYANRVEVGIGTGVFGCGCGGSGGTGRYGTSGTILVTTPDSLQTQLERATRQCAIPDGGVDVALELTGDEIVDVQANHALEPVKTCVIEAVWATNVITGDKEHRGVTVHLR